jgi:hypothetical protein
MAMLGRRAASRHMVRTAASATKTPPAVTFMPVQPEAPFHSASSPTPAITHHHLEPESLVRSSAYFAMRS